MDALDRDGCAGQSSLPPIVSHLGSPPDSQPITGGSPPKSAPVYTIAPVIVSQNAGEPVLKACAAAPMAGRGRAALPQDLRQVLPAGHRPSAARCTFQTSAGNLYYRRRDSIPSFDRFRTGGRLKRIPGGKMVPNHTPNEWPRSRAAPHVSSPSTLRLRGALGVAARSGGLTRGCSRVNP